MDAPADGNITRRRHVESREVIASEVIVIDTAAAQPAAPMLREVVAADSPPAIEPTRLGERRRKRRHQRRYRLAQWGCVLSVIATAAAVVCIAMGDLRVGLASAVGASALGLAGVVVGGANRLSSRLLGTAVAITVLAMLVTLCAIGLPRGWFELH